MTRDEVLAWATEAGLFVGRDNADPYVGECMPVEIHEIKACIEARAAPGK